MASEFFAKIRIECAILSALGLMQWITGVQALISKRQASNSPACAGLAGSSGLPETR